MRTTLVLDDDLVVKAKQMAAQSHNTLSEVVNQALRELVSASTRVKEAPVPYRALTFGDATKPIAMEPADFSALDDQEDSERLGY
jgi:Arc/MetJ family transcription regulator